MLQDVIRLIKMLRQWRETLQADEQEQIQRDWLLTCSRAHENVLHSCENSFSLMFHRFKTRKLCNFNFYFKDDQIPHPSTFQLSRRNFTDFLSNN